MSSDKLSSVQEPVVSLDMDVQTNTDRHTVSVELGREDLKKLITSLEAANKVQVYTFADRLFLSRNSNKIMCLHNRPLIIVDGGCIALLIM